MRPIHSCCFVPLTARYIAPARPVAVSPPTAYEVAQSCTFGAATDQTGATKPFSYWLTCPHPAGHAQSDIIRHGMWMAGVMALYLEQREFVALQVADPPTGSVRGCSCTPD